MQHLGGPKRQGDDPDAAHQADQRRRVQLALMSKRNLVALYSRMMRARGSVSIMGGPVSKHDYVDAVACLERETAMQKAHFEDYGAGHEQCPSVNWATVCDKPAQY